MAQKAQKINWTRERIEKANIPADAAAYVKEVRRNCQNAMSDEELLAQHARFTEVLKRR